MTFLNTLCINETNRKQLKKPTKFIPYSQQMNNRLYRTTDPICSLHMNVMQYESVIICDYRNRINKVGPIFKKAGVELTKDLQSGRQQSGQ